MSELFLTNRVFTLSYLASPQVMYHHDLRQRHAGQPLPAIAEGRAAVARRRDHDDAAGGDGIVLPDGGTHVDRIEPRVIASLGMALTGIGLVGFALLDEPQRAASDGVLCLAVCGSGSSLFQFAQRQRHHGRGAATGLFAPGRDVGDRA
ncbi:MAG: hypothetical protein IPM80_00025 [Proteobacteria bacterium]|nr:hypothetical protein [Pseudomonadota bacterium]